MNQIKIIKPKEGEGIYPKPDVRRIYPTKRLLFKFYLTSFLIWIAILIGIIAFFALISFITQIEGTSSDSFPIELLDLLVLLFWGCSVIAFVLVIILLPIYVNSMEFIVHGDEVVVKKGLFNKTVKYCPFRTVTNISTTAGPLDRLFGIGCVNIETAGKSKASTGPEEKLEGLILFHEIRDYILTQLRSYDPSKGWGIHYMESKDLHRLQKATLAELKEIKEILRKEKR